MLATNRVEGKASRINKGRDSAVGKADSSVRKAGILRIPIPRIARAVINANATPKIPRVVRVSVKTKT